VKVEAVQQPPSPSPAVQQGLDGGAEAQPPAVATSTPDLQLFDDEDDAKPVAARPVLNLALGMGTEAADPRRSASPAPSRLTGTAKVPAAASAGGGRRPEEEEDGIPPTLRGVGCSEQDLMLVLPFLGGLLPAAMAMPDVFK
jgi:hypothetical protein